MANEVSFCMTLLIDCTGCWEHCVQKESPTVFHFNQKECCDHPVMSAAVEEVKSTYQELTILIWEYKAGMEFCLKHPHSYKILLHYFQQLSYCTRLHNQQYEYPRSSTHFKVSNQWTYPFLGSFSWEPFLLGLPVRATGLCWKVGKKGEKLKSQCCSYLLLSE